MIQKTTIFGADKDQFFMELALKEAHKAFARDEVPIGAIVVSRDGEILGRGSNNVEKMHSQVAHAEMLAVQRAGKKFGDWRLEGCWLYVTLEPCSMCMNMILLSRIKGLAFGATSPLFGFHLDNALSIELYRNSKLQLVQGVCGDESANLLKRFFQPKRI